MYKTEFFNNTIGNWLCGKVVETKDGNFRQPLKWGGRERIYYIEKSFPNKDLLCKHFWKKCLNKQRINENNKNKQ